MTHATPRHRPSKTRAIGYRFVGDIDVAAADRILTAARDAGVVTEFNAKHYAERNDDVWFNGVPGKAMRDVRARIAGCVRWLRPSPFGDKRIDRFALPNAFGALRTVVVLRNDWGRYTWRLLYQDNPAIADREHEYTQNWFDTAAAARRSARRFVRTLGQ